MTTPNPPAQCPARHLDARSLAAVPKADVAPPAAKVDLAAMVASVEEDDGSGTPPPAGVGAEETERRRLTRWIGDPLPATVS